MNPGERVKVLIADDSDVFVRSLRAMLAQIGGIEVLGRARTGAEASQLVRDLHPDVVILDLRMPGGSGIDVLNSMKSDGLTPIVMVLTNFPCSQYREICLRLGARFFFDKSAAFEKAGEVLRRLVHRASASTGVGSPGPPRNVPDED
jgi:DNA-binding NarL/FixJ family response regulator